MVKDKENNCPNTTQHINKRKRKEVFKTMVKESHKITLDFSEDCDEDKMSVNSVQLDTTNENSPDLILVPKKNEY